MTDIFPASQQLEINGKEKISTGRAILAIGHSARDTFKMLFDRGICMEAKSFAVGVRVEHRQEMIDGVMYGRTQRGSLPPAAYKLAEKVKDGRGSLYFLHVSRRYVVNASSEEGYLAVNGMSYLGRAGENANSAVHRDCDAGGLWGRIILLREWSSRESLRRNAWKAGKERYRFSVRGLLQRKSIRRGGESSRPNMKGEYCFADGQAYFSGRNRTGCTGRDLCDEP